MRLIAATDGKRMLRVSVENMKAKHTQTALEVHEKMRQIFHRLHAENVSIAYLLRGGNPAPTILEVAGEIAADLIVMASDARNNIGDFIIGTITEQVVNHSECPVLVIPYRPQ